MFYIISSFIFNIFIIIVSRFFQIFQPQRIETGNKSIVPTLGGIAMFASLNFMFFENVALLLLANSFALIGLIDDIYKLRSRSSSGLFIKTRLILEILISGAFCYNILLKDQFRSNILFIGDFWWLSLIWGIWIIISSANSFNLTDGVDALAGSLGFWVFLFIYLKTADILALNVCYILLGYLILNAPPAKIIMGDVGALGLGALMGAMFFKHKIEWFLPLIGIGFIIETLSSAIQICSYKLKKRRLFLMAPIHHHFEKKGYSKIQILILFNFLTLISFAFIFIFF